jgi:hypothetical protein
MQNSPTKGTSLNSGQAKWSTPTKQKQSVTPSWGKPIEIISDRLFWVADVKPPQNYKDAFFFNIDNVSTDYRF